MLSRGRPCLRRRLSAAFDPAATRLDGPLPFLYPRWATPALRQRRPISFKAIETTICRSSSAPSRPLIPSCPSFARHSCRWISDASDRGTAPIPTSSSANTVLSDQNEKRDAADSIEGLERDGDIFDTEVGRAPRPTELTESAKKKARAKRVQMGLKGNRPSGENKPGQKPQRVLMNSERDETKMRARQYMQKQYANKGKKYVAKAWKDTQDVLYDIERKVKRKNQSPPNQKEIFVSEEVLQRFAGVNEYTLRENIWYMLVNNGCRVQVLPVSENQGVLRRVVLSGTERAQELVQQRFARTKSVQESGDPLDKKRKLQFPICTTPTAFHKSGSKPPLFRGIWATDPTDEPRTFDEIMEAHTEIRTVKDLTEHIEDVTTAKLPPHSQKKHPESRIKQSYRIAKHIMITFEKNQKHLSAAALHLALKFLLAHMHLVDAQTLASRSVSVATRDTYHIMMKHAADTQDIIDFRNLVRAMGRANISPNAETRLILLGALTEPTEKAQLIAHMVQQGDMSDLSVTRSALQQTIQNSLLVHMNSGKPLDSYLDLLLNTHGANWFSPPLMGQMFEVLSRLKKHDAIAQLCEFCIDRRIQLDDVSLIGIILAHRSNVFTAIHLILPFLEQQASLDQDATPSANLLGNLFLTSFQGRHYNICRVLWQYACLSDRTTYKMKQCVLVGLSTNVSDKKFEPRRIWDTDSGKVIIGYDFHHGASTLDSSIMNDIPEARRDNLLLFITENIPAGIERHSQVRLANALVQRDMKLHKRYKPEHPLRIMLDAAAHMDSEWHDVPHPLEWKMNNAINIPLAEKEEQPPRLLVQEYPDAQEVFQRLMEDRSRLPDVLEELSREELSQLFKDPVPLPDVPEELDDELPQRPKKGRSQSPDVRKEPSVKEIFGR
ncbi:unnamed protein product [Penicillium salamii]|uniref:Uncharacterized protein n=1 Tax=Penicillium salamii TaxID=1612424 RepID=A0A9W4NVG3_9EURO|nr:unnamed protein product [Penicillium salamii]CAG8194107.1 unnamed protein product [Penicillium salamii]CAG8307062.1 unnamed protein product [Penicillium salamii]CAG8360350.1 unnamed protein product [Penicillium salamii]CAG8406026.1 unnamed protein product [Penicillium salamii]